MRKPGEPYDRRPGERIISIGFRELAMKLHPDHGGSAEEFARLLRIRDRLRFVNGSLKKRPGV